MSLTVGSLFAGIGGFDLGFERAGFEIRWQVEIDPFCRQVLAKHWPAVKRYEDVRTVGDELERVDVLCGGFPCQDISVAGAGAGLDGERSGLWREYARLIRELRPRYVVVENVAALLGRGLGRVLGDLAESGYDAEWDCIPASAVGAPHQRDRVWIVAYARSSGRDARRAVYPRAGRALFEPSGPGKDVADTNIAGLEGRHGEVVPERPGQWSARSGGASVADASSGIRQRETSREGGHAALGCQAMADADADDQRQLQRQLQPQRGECDERRWARNSRPRIFANANRESLERIAESRGERGQWCVEPNVGRVAHGVPARVDRLRGLGNSIVPQIAEWIARRIREAEGLA